MHTLNAGMIWQRSIPRWLLATISLTIALLLISCFWSSSENAPSLSRMMQIQPGAAYENGEHDPRANIAAIVKQDSLQNPLAQNPLAAPELLYSSYIGGDGTDESKDVALDADGNIYIIGKTFSDTLFDVEIERSGYSDIFVAKFDPTGAQLLYAVVIGGQDSESPLSIDVDAQGNVYGTAMVFDETFPTKDALWTTPPESTNTVLFKLNGDGDLVYSTYLPLNSFDSKQNLVVDDAGNAYVVGSYPWVEEDETYWGQQIGVVKIDPTGSQLLLDRHYGSTSNDYGTAIALDDKGNIYLAGVTKSEEFPVTDNAHQSQCGAIIYDPNDYCYESGAVVILNAAGEVIYASYHGGSFSEDPAAIVADGEGTFVIAGETTSAQFPLSNPIQDSCPIDPATENCYTSRGFVSAVHVDLESGTEQGTLTYSTYLGATERNSNNVILDAAMDSSGNVYITGYTNGKKFPLADAIQGELSEGFCYTFNSERYCFDAFITKISPSGELLMSTYLGGALDEYPHGITVDGEGNIYLTGTTEARNFPTTTNAYEPFDLLNDDGFLVKIGVADDTAPTPTPTATSLPDGSPTPVPTSGPGATSTPPSAGNPTPVPTATPPSSNRRQLLLPALGS